MRRVKFNVSKNGRYLFRTDWFLFESDAKDAKAELIERFPSREGFKVEQIEQDATFYPRVISE